MFQNANIPCIAFIRTDYFRSQHTLNDIHNHKIVKKYNFSEYITRGKEGTAKGRQVLHVSRRCNANRLQQQ